MYYIEYSLLYYLLLYLLTTTVQSRLCTTLQVHLNKLECRGKAHLFQ